MRPIDADELLRKAKASQDNNLHRNEAERIAHYREHDRFLKMIERAPTINPEDLRPKGKWEQWDDTDCWMCSECKHEVLCSDFKPTELDMHFCPNCGAEMEE